MLASDVLVADPLSRSPSAESVSSTSTNAGGVSNASGHILALKDASGRMVKVTVWDGTFLDPGFWVAFVGIAMRAAA